MECRYAECHYVERRGAGTKNYFGEKSIIYQLASLSFFKQLLELIEKKPGEVKCQPLYPGKKWKKKIEKKTFERSKQLRCEILMFHFRSCVRFHLNFHFVH